MTHKPRSRRRLMGAVTLTGLAVAAMLAVMPGAANAASTSRCAPWWTHQDWASSLWASTCIVKDGMWSYASVTTTNTGVIPIRVQKLTIYNTASGTGTSAGTVTCGERWVNPGQTYSCMTGWAWDSSPTVPDQGWSSVLAFMPNNVGTSVNLASPFL